MDKVICSGRFTHVYVLPIFLFETQLNSQLTRRGKSDLTADDRCLSKVGLGDLDTRLSALHHLDALLSNASYSSWLTGCGRRGF